MQSGSAAAAVSSPPAPPGFSHVHITSPWLCHSCNSCLLIPHHSSSLLLSLLSLGTPRTKALLIQRSPWCRMQGLLGRGCVRQDNNYIFAHTKKKRTLQIVWKLCLLVLWEDQHPEDFHLESQEAQTKTHWTWGQIDLMAELKKKFTGIWIMAPIGNPSNPTTHKWLETGIKAIQRNTAWYKKYSCAVHTACRGIELQNNPHKSNHSSKSCLIHIPLPITIIIFI